MKRHGERRNKRAGVAGVAAVLVVLLSGCGVGSPGAPGGGESTTPWYSSSPRSATASPSGSGSSSVVVPSPTGPQPSDTFTPDQLEAANTLIEYFRISDEIFGSLDADPQPLKDITTAQIQEQDAKELNVHRQQGQVQKGSTVVRITGASEPVEADGMRSIDVRACTDTSRADIMNAQTGEIAVPKEERTLYMAWNINVVKTDDGWKIGDSTNDVDLGCRV